MADEGAGLRCSDCHRAEAHQWPGSRYDVRATDPEGRGGPMGREDVATCESCHGTAPHDGASLDGWKLNHHTDRVACQTCHIPALARGGVPTKTWWDWSTAGQLGADGKPKVEKDAQGNVTYDTKKGTFRWETDLQPEYRWFDGQVRYTELGDPIDPTAVVSINRIQGGYDDPDSRIWPFKVMRGRQAYDVDEKHLLFVHLFGKDDAAYWKTLDWTAAIRAGMAGTGVSFSGQHGFVETEMSWPSTHMVAPADQALGCDDCHAEGGRLDPVTGFYLPGRDRFRWLDLAGMAAVGLVLISVVGHGGLRLSSKGGAK
jgi:octaheme c-type cytochrome (tetrathionate reductase family)